jgi:hypothetical protein
VKANSSASAEQVHGGEASKADLISEPFLYVFYQSDKQRKSENAFAASFDKQEAPLFLTVDPDWMPSLRASSSCPLPDELPPCSEVRLPDMFPQSVRQPKFQTVNSPSQL